MTLQDALVAYATYARAEGKSPKTVAWVVSSMGYFAEFLGSEQQDIDTITGNDLRRFIIALQGRPLFPYAVGKRGFQSMLDFVCQKSSDGKYFAESIHAAYADFDFGQMEEPSRWLTFLVNRIEKRAS